MDKMERRKAARYSFDEIPEVLRKPVLLLNYEEVKSQIINLSPLGISLSVDKEIDIDKESVFQVKFRVIDSYIQCICVFSDIYGDNRIVNAYFTDVEDSKAMMKILKTTDIKDNG